MGERFKTGYLADRTSFSQLGKEIGDDITSSIDKISATRKQRQLELDSRMGFTKAQNENLPAGLSGRYMKGTQIALESMQEKAAVAYSTGNASDVQAYQQAKQEYNDLKNIGVSVSSREREIIDNISVGAFPNLTGTVPETLEDYKSHDQGDFRYEGGRLMFVDTDGSEKPWRESRINDPRGGFLPQLKWEGSDFMVAPLATDIYNTSLSGREGLYQVKYEGTDFQTGEMNDAEFFSAVQRNIDNKLVANPNEMAEAISLHGYKVNEVPNKSDLSQQDVLAAGRIYPAEAFTRNNKFLRGTLNSQGEFEFESSIDDFPETIPEEQRDIVINAREAKKTYYESVAGDLKERIKLDDESGKYMEQLDEQAKELLEAQLEAVADNAEDIGMAPSLIWDGDSQYTMVHAADSRYKMKLDGKPVNIDETYFEFVDGPDGESIPVEVGFKTSATMSKQEMIQQLLDAGEDSAAAQSVVDNWFAKYDNTIISRMVTDQSGNAHVEPNFMRIMTGLNNGIFTSGEKPGSQIHRALGKRKMMLHRNGELVEGSLTRNGIEQVQATQPVTVAPSSPAGTTPTTTTSPAPSTPPSSTTTPATTPPATSTSPTPTTQAAPAPAPAPAAGTGTTPVAAPTPAPEPEPEPEPANLDVTPTAEEVQIDNTLERGMSALLYLEAGNGMNTLLGLQKRGTFTPEMSEKLQEGLVPIYVSFNPKTHVSPVELEAMKDMLSDDGERNMIAYMSIDELEKMSAGDYAGWRMDFEAKEVERLRTLTASEQPAPEQPTEDRVTATVTPGDETDVANIEVPTASEPAKQEQEEAEQRQATVSLNDFYNSLDELADFNEDGAEEVQDYYESLGEKQQEAFMRLVINNYKREPRQYPVLSGGTLKFVGKSESVE